MLALQTRAVSKILPGQQYAGIPKDIDNNNLQSLDPRAPVVVTQTKMESRVVVVPVPTTVVVTHYVPSNTTKDADSAALPTVSTPPVGDVPPPPEAPVADGDAPQFASFIPPTSQQISPVPTTAPGQEPPNEVPVDDGNAEFGTFVPITSQEVSPVPTTEPVQEPPADVPANNRDAPQFASFIPPTSEEAAPVPTTVPGQEPPAEVPVADGDAPQFASFIPPTSQEVNPVPTTIPGQEPEPAPPATSPETTSSVSPTPQSTSQEVSQETTTAIEPIAEPTSQEAPQETTESTSPIDVPGPATTDAENPVQTSSQPAVGEASLDGPDPVTTAAPNPSQSSTQAATQGGPGNTPENARLIIETESSLSLSATPTSEVLQFDTAPFTYTGPSARSTTLQTRRGTSTDVSVAESTQTSDSFGDDDGETGVAGSEPLYTTATLADGVVTTIELSATAGSDHSETQSPDASVKDKSDGESNVPPMVVGSVLGSILGISMLALVIFWLMRRRKLQRRRSTLLTPLGARPGAPPGNLMKYEIDNQSLGPTPRSTKVAASMSANAKKFSQRIRQSMSDASHIGMSRGNSQFGHESQAMTAGHAHSRASSTPGQQPQNGWWAELLGESNINDPPAVAPPMQQQSYDGRRTPSPNPFSDANSSVAAPPAPFHEYSHSVPPHGSMVPRPLYPAREDDPFADGDSIISPELARQSPTIYAGPGRRSPSMSRNLTPQSTGDNVNLKPQEVWRGKVHSNPFDLELDTRVVPSMYGNIQQVPRHTVASSFYSTANAGNNNNQYTSRQSRADSFTSKYTSGVSSVGEWPPVPPRVPSIYSRYGNDGTDFPVPAQDFRGNDDNAWRHGNGNMM